MALTTTLRRLCLVFAGPDAASLPGLEVQTDIYDDADYIGPGRSTIASADTMTTPIKVAGKATTLGDLLTAHAALMKDSQVAALNAQVTDRDTTIAGLTAQVGQLQAQLDQLQAPAPQEAPA